jgi:hypothetical protein
VRVLRGGVRAEAERRAVLLDDLPPARPPAAADGSCNFHPATSCNSRPSKLKRPNAQVDRRLGRGPAPDGRPGPSPPCQRRSLLGGGVDAEVGTLIVCRSRRRVKGGGEVPPFASGRRGYPRPGPNRRSGQGRTTGLQPGGAADAGADGSGVRERPRPLEGEPRCLRHRIRHALGGVLRVAHPGRGIPREWVSRPAR